MIDEIQAINTALVAATRDEAESLQRVMDMWSDICDQIVKDNPTFEALPDYSDLMTLEDWKSTVISGGFINYDGWGDLATETKTSSIKIQPSDVLFDKYIPEWVTHIVWYNR